MSMDIWFYGLADANGVESFIEDLDVMASEVFQSDKEKKAKNSQQFAMCLRAQANQQKHSVVFRVLMNTEDSDQVETLMKESSFVEALQMIKDKAKEVQLGTYGTTKSAAAKNWGMISNPALDPGN